MGFYAVPGPFSLQKSQVFRSGRIYGMDVNSGAPVAVLLSSLYDVGVGAPTHDERPEYGDNTDEQYEMRVLDLCCAPCLKLCALADMMACSEAKQKNIRIVGVDASESRLANGKRIVTKYHVDPDTAGSNRVERISIQLFYGDGRTFGTRCHELDLQYDSTVEADELGWSKQKRKRKNKSARTREKKRLRQLADEEIALTVNGAQTPTLRTSSADTNCLVIQQFDRVLVDAECSTDGSLKHIAKRSSKSNLKSTSTEQLGSSPLTCLPSLTDANELAKLVQLQRDLIKSGFRLLKPGGFMVYSTCSLSEDQNEAVVSWLLEQFPREAYLVPIKFPLMEDDDNEVSLVSVGSLSGTIRFRPNPQAFETQSSKGLNEAFPRARLYGDGFFLAKIGKVGPNNS